MIAYSIAGSIAGRVAYDITQAFNEIASADFFVDGENGSDSNDGLTPITAKQTLSAVASLVNADGQIVGIARGSYHTGDVASVSGYADIEAIAYTPPNNATAVPEIYGRVVKSTWNKTTSYTNVYDCDVDKTTWTGESENFITAFESVGAATEVERTDVLLQEIDFDTDLATTLATLDSSPDSFYVDKASTPAKCYIHTANSDNPNSNGKAYSVSQVESALIGFWKIQNIYYDGCCQDDGLRASFQYNNESVNHVNHNFYVEAGSANTWLASGCISRNVRARKDFAVDKRDSAGPYIWFESSGSGKSGTFLNCQSIQDTALNAKLQNDYIGAFGCHSGSGTMDTLTVQSCYGSNGGLLAVSPGNVATVNVTDSRFLDFRYGITAGTGNVTINALANYWKGSTLSPLRSMERVISNCPTGITVNFKGNVVQPAKSSNGTIDCDVAGTFNIQYNTFEDEYDTPNILIIRIRHADAVVNINNNIFDGANWPIYSDGAYAANISGDNNLYYQSTQGWYYNSSTHSAIADWRTASGMDANSVIIDPDWANSPSTWDEVSDAIANAAQAATLSAGAEYYTT